MIFYKYYQKPSKLDIIRNLYDLDFVMDHLKEVQK